MSNGILGGFGIVMGAIAASIADMFVMTILILFFNAIYTLMEPLDSAGLGAQTVKLIILMLWVFDGLGAVVFVCAVIGGLLMMIKAPFNMIGGRY